jgi:hypothetical protein
MVQISSKTEKMRAIPLANQGPLEWNLCLGRLGSNKSFFKLNYFSSNHFHFLIIVLHTCKFAKISYGTFIANLAKEVGSYYY